MKHLDLFSGIGGFALAADWVWGDVEHTFVEIDPFCQKVLLKHWPKARIYGDIRTITNTEGIGTQGRIFEQNADSEPEQVDLITGGFPCQPFSQAGKRGGTADNRYLWPEMLRVISEFRPTWVIAENVRGLLTWNEGLVFEQVCTDLESEGYEVQPFIIPACSVNAPHRRDRVWFVANRPGGWEWSSQPERNRSGQSEAEIGNGNSDAENSISQRGSGRLESNGQILECQSPKTENAGPSWEANWTEVAAELCRVDDGLSPGLDEFSGYTKARHRQERLKALGNAIVPQVAEKIMRGMT